MKHILPFLIGAMLCITSCTCPPEINKPLLAYKVDVVLCNNSQFTITYSIDANNIIMLAPDGDTWTKTYKSYNEPESIDISTLYHRDIIVSYDDEYFITYSFDDTFHSLLNPMSYMREVDESGEKFTFTFTFTDEDYEYATMYGSPAVEKFIRE